jgi:hypothetical protein
MLLMVRGGTNEDVASHFASQVGPRAAAALVSLVKLRPAEHFGL